MNLKLWQVDAFARRPFEGNPAAIVPLDEFPDAARMQAIANENNLAETAFLVRRARGEYDLRWFTPAAEVDLCGHATLASAWLVFAEIDPGLDSVAFSTRSGILTVERGSDGEHVMSLPSDPVARFEGAPDLAERVGSALGTTAPVELRRGRYLMGVWEKAEDVRAIRDCGDIATVLRLLDLWAFIATAPGDEVFDFISRFFAPDKGVPEDPVTGSAHCALTPYWAARTGRKSLTAFQASPRGGILNCRDEGERTVLSGPCALYLRGEIVA